MSFTKIEVSPEQIMAEVGTMSIEQLDSLPFGAIELDPSGVVLTYNRFESQFAGRAPSEVVGKNFFSEVAPCTRVRRFHGAFEDGVERRELNEVFDFTFNFPAGQRLVRIRMLYSERPRPGVWIFVTPLEG